MQRVGSVISRDGVDGAISKRDENGFTVGTRTQRRIHFEVGVVFADVRIGQAKMVRGDFTGDTRFAALAASDCFQRIGR